MDAGQNQSSAVCKSNERLGGNVDKILWKDREIQTKSDIPYEVHKGDMIRIEPHLFRVKDVIFDMDRTFRELTGRVTVRLIIVEEA